MLRADCQPELFFFENHEKKREGRTSEEDAASRLCSTIGTRMGQVSPRMLGAGDNLRQTLRSNAEDDERDHKDRQPWGIVKGVGKPP